MHVLCLYIVKAEPDDERHTCSSDGPRRKKTLMKLLIAEKYKVAAPFANLLGAKDKSHVSFNKGNTGWLEGNGWAVTWCAGHLLQMCMPDEYDDEYKRWSLDTLPFVPKRWKSKPGSSAVAKAQLKVIRDLIKSGDIDEIYHAADADREGELIVREVLEYLDATDIPAKRVWYTNVTKEALTKALDEAKPLSDYDDLGNAAKMRQYADYILGINLSRAYTVYIDETANTGRVISPAVNLVVERQAAIDAFVPQDYITITAGLRSDEGEFPAQARYDDIERGREVAKLIKGKDATIVSVEQKEASERRKLYDLTSLQADAAKLFGYDATTTADIAQKLYEQGWQSYPRTNSNYINPEQVDETAPLLPAAASKVFSGSAGIDTDRLDVQRIVQAKGAGAEASHTGLCPTMQGIEAYRGQIRDNRQLRNIFVLVCARMLCSCLPPRRCLKTSVGVDIEGEAFSANGNVELDPGFLPFEKKVLAGLGKKVKETKDKTLPELHEGDIYQVKSVRTKTSKTKPPKPYTTASLLEQMKDIASVLPDKEMRDILRKQGAGLGTQSSRDTVIATMKSSNFVEVRGGYIYPTDKAKDLMSILPDDIKSPVMTATMELDLNGIATGSKDPADMYREVVREIRKDIDAVRAMPQRERKVRLPKNSKPFKGCVCPRCGGSLVESPKSVTCTECGLVIWRTTAKKKVPLTEIKSILKTGMSTEKLSGFKSKKGNDFSCWLYLDETGRVSFDFDDEGRKAKDNLVTRKARGAAQS